MAKSPYKCNEEISNCIMASSIGHYFWLLVIDRCYSHKEKYTLLSTDPQLFSEIYAENKDMVHVLPDRLFNHAPWFEENHDIYAKHYNTSSM
jgi:hypothetical protein